MATTYVHASKETLNIVRVEMLVWIASVFLTRLPKWFGQLVLTVAEPRSATTAEFLVNLPMPRCLYQLIRYEHHSMQI